MSLYRYLYDQALKRKAGTSYLTYGRHIIVQWVAAWEKDNRSRIIKPKILDVGCGTGEDLSQIQRIFKGRCDCFGIEESEHCIRICRSKGLKRIVALNVERDRFPFPDHFFDVVLCNQILEHTKDSFHLLSELSRIIAAGGMAIIGIPNLAAWHDRLILLLGRQPSGIKFPGPHVRGITPPGLKEFVELDGYFSMTDCRGSGFYPFPAGLSMMLSRLFPRFSTALFCLFVRTRKPGVFIDVLASRVYETNYYKGLPRDGNPLHAASVIVDIMTRQPLFQGTGACVPAASALESAEKVLHGALGAFRKYCTTPDPGSWQSLHFNLRAAVKEILEWVKTKAATLGITVSSTIDASVPENAAGNPFWFSAAAFSDLTTLLSCIHTGHCRIDCTLSRADAVGMTVVFTLYECDSIPVNAAGGRNQEGIISLAYPFEKW